MEITKSQKRLFIILGIVLCYAVYEFIGNSDVYFNFYSEDEKKPALVSTSEDSTHKVQPKVEHTYLAGWGKDPFYIPQVLKFKKAKKKKDYTPTLQLYAISYKGTQSAALINDKFLKVGAMIEGFHLKKIEKNRVTLSDGKRTIKLILVKY